MGVIKKLKSPNRVLVCIGGDELIEEMIGLRSGEQFRVGQMLSFIAATKLRQKSVEVPRGAVKISFDQPTGQYQILFMEPGDLGEDC